VARGAHAFGSGDLVEAPGVQVKAHVAVIGVDEDVVGAAGELDVAFGVHFRGVLVVDDLVSFENVVAVVKLDAPDAGPHVADQGLAVGRGLDGGPGDLRLRFGHRQQLLIRIVGQRVGGRLCGGVLGRGSRGWGRDLLRLGGR
jgi:hypothetical protein